MSSYDSSHGIATLVLPPLPLVSLPPLPRINNPDIERIVLTHSSLHGLPKAREEINLAEEAAVEDYEKLEHVGDALLGATVVTMLHDMYPSLKQGPAAFLKDRLVCNATLAQISDRYALPARLRGGNEIYTTRQSEKVRASVFEAYIAGVYYDFLRAGEQSSVDTTDNTHGVADDEDCVQEMFGLALSRDLRKAMGPSITRTGLIEPLTPTKAIVKKVQPRPVTPPAQRPVVPEDPFAELLQYSRPRPSPSPPSRSSHTTSSSEDTAAILAPLMRQVGGPRSYPGRNRGQAFYRLELWLHPLYVPLAHWALGCMQMNAAQLEDIPLKPPKPKQNEQADHPEWEVEDYKAANAPQLLQAFVVWKRAMAPIFTFTFDPETGLHETICQMRPLPERKRKPHPVPAKRVDKKLEKASVPAEREVSTATGESSDPIANRDNAASSAVVKAVPSMNTAPEGGEESVAEGEAAVADAAELEDPSQLPVTAEGSHDTHDHTLPSSGSIEKTEIDTEEETKGTAAQTEQLDKQDDRSTWNGKRFDNLVGTGVRGVKVHATNVAAYLVLKQIGIAHWLRVEEGLVEDLFE